MKKFDPEKWNARRAAHLLGRAGFGATPEQIDAAAAKPMDEIINDLFKPTSAAPPPSWVTPGVEFKPDQRELARGLTEDERRRYRRLIQREYNLQLRELTGWWVDRMIHSPRPLREKMALFWHGHFATSHRKVRVPYMMYIQNQTFRDKGLGNWGDLLTAVSRDPAMLIYLDNTRSRVGAPNENYARELMELFSLGEGHYTEQDIKEVARALTGWVVDPKEYKFLDATQIQPATRGGKQAKNRYHDTGDKTFFGQTGDFDGHDVIRVILEQERAARFICEKLWSFFAYENPEPELIDELAAVLRENDYELEPLLRAMFKSHAFYSKKATMTQIKSPARWLAGACVALGVEHPDATFSTNALRSLGQELFAPPNVKGWDGGYAWITTSSLTARYNLANQLINHRTRPPQKEGERKNRFSPHTVDPLVALPKEKRAEPEAAMNYLTRRFYQTKLKGEEKERLNAFLGSQPPPAEWTDAQTRNVFHVLMSTPRYQLT